jgi:hypothetical protein
MLAWGWDTAAAVDSSVGKHQGYARMANSMDEIVETLMSLLFKGISLTPAQDARARFVIDSCVREQRRQVGQAAPHRVPALRLRLTHERDSTLRALLASEAVRTRFDTNRRRLPTP